MRNSTHIRLLLLLLMEHQLLWSWGKQRTAFVDGTVGS
jgi:hypothetical protein